MEPGDDILASLPLGKGTSRPWASIRFELVRHDAAALFPCAQPPGVAADTPPGTSQRTPNPPLHLNCCSGSLALGPAHGLALKAGDRWRPAIWGLRLAGAATSHGRACFYAWNPLILHLLRGGAGNFYKLMVPAAAAVAPGS